MITIKIDKNNISNINNIVSNKLEKAFNKASNQFMKTTYKNRFTYNYAQSANFHKRAESKMKRNKARNIWLIKTGKSKKSPYDIIVKVKKNLENATAKIKIHYPQYINYRVSQSRIPGLFKQMLQALKMIKTSFKQGLAFIKQLGFKNLTEFNKMFKEEKKRLPKDRYSFKNEFKYLSNNDLESYKNLIKKGIKNG